MLRTRPRAQIILHNKPGGAERNAQGDRVRGVSHSNPPAARADEQKDSVGKNQNEQGLAVSVLFLSVSVSGLFAARRVLKIE